MLLVSGLLISPNLVAGLQFIITYHIKLLTRFVFGLQRENIQKDFTLFFCSIGFYNLLLLKILSPIILS